MIVAEELLSREWKCFEHLIRHRRREGNHISLPKLERPSSESRLREENRTLALHLSLVVRISHSMEMVKPPTRLVIFSKPTAPRENVGGSIQRYFVGLFGICSGDACRWDQQSLLPPFCT
jgi:hypothetical protein